MTMRWLLSGLLLLLSACTTLPVQEAPHAPAVAAHPLGYTLPPAAPNLYDNSVFKRFALVAQRPFQIHGQRLAL